ncbi:MAG TPA: ATP-binding protein [Phenylobacterium sp.]|uniref:ATP-binding protein n=1 Tax=Phenylobacterium sp. TaxID=1871053 RepID=UPI002B660292|nr:ATP-binding protein [Phenylobacterium sp.]HSV04645.1 ATP-binding protein [Phenylobacterium sp.]
MFAPAAAQITLLVDGKPWRSRDPEGRRPRGRPLIAEMVVESGEPLWIADARRDPRFAEASTVTGPPHARLIAAAPIRLPDGSIPGSLGLASPLPRDHDPELAQRLQDLADLLADEWRRVQAKAAQEVSRRQSEAARQVLGGIISNAPLSLIMMDNELRILAASRRWLASRGLRVRQAVGHRLAEVMPQAAQWSEALARCLAGETVESERGRVQMPDGSWRWYRSEITPWRVGSGEVGGVLISGHDVTDMVEALERSERSEARLKLALELADIHVWEMDYVRQELIKVGAEDTFFDKPKTYHDLASDIWGTIDERDRPATMELWDRHLSDRAPYRPEYRVARGDGKEVWVQGSVRLIHNEQGEAVGLLGALQNVTERKKGEQALLRAKEEAEAATRAKSAFLATMSHEIRTPLNGVLGMAQAMSHGELSDRQRERLDVIRQSGEALLAILNDVLDLSKIEAGKLELETTAFDISELARNAHATFAATAQAKGVAFELNVARRAQGIYLGDPVRLRQILYNLVSNALKFTDKGAVKVKVGRREGRLTITVADTGIGVAPDKLAILFRKFEQADASMTRRFGGTGLGLAICRELTEVMGGAISASSTLGKGATFLVELPLPKSRAPRKTSASARPAPEMTVAPSALRVLAAEDNGMNRLVLKTLLSQIGIDPVMVSDGRQAVEAWAREPWDLILMDVQMPEMDGPTAAAIIRAREDGEGRPRTPIVALTANVMSHQIREYRAAGMDAFVAKPIEAARLFEAVLAAAQREDGAAAGQAAA